jgi:hypothetical protein
MNVELITRNDLEKFKKELFSHQVENKKVFEDEFDSVAMEKILRERMEKTKKKKDTTLCSRGINAAKAKYDVYPSAYANGYAVQVCKGTMPGLDGKKRCSGKYCSGK